MAPQLRATSLNITFFPGGSADASTNTTDAQDLASTMQASLADTREAGRWCMDSGNSHRNGNSVHAHRRA